MTIYSIHRQVLPGEQGLKELMPERFRVLIEAPQHTGDIFRVYPLGRTVPARDWEKLEALLNWLGYKKSPDNIWRKPKMETKSMPTHPELVARLTKDGFAILADLTPESVHLLHMAVGISGEAGELLDAVKKVAIYNKPIDRANVVEELGDLEFYMEGLRASLGITREETLAANIGKLSVRYGAKYSNEAAQARADKA